LNLKLTANKITPIRASVMKIPLQSVSSSNTLPRIGERIGAKPLTAISRAKKAANSRPWYKSVEIAREITTAPAEDTPWINRNTIIAYTLGKRIIAIVLIK